MSGAALRERGKARRYAAIVTAATNLWRKHGIEHVSLNQIAATAEVAPQTVYNLIGGIDAIGFAVIRRALERLDAALNATSAAGIDLAVESARISAELYTEDPDLYRQLMVRIPRALLEGTHLGRDVAQITVLAMTQAIANGEISSEVDPDRLGRTIYTGYLGALYEWACGDTDNADFLLAAEIAVLAPVTACATKTAQPVLATRLFNALSGDGRKQAAG